MTAKDISDSVKKATVALMTKRPDSTPGHPFKIKGRGFSVHPAGIVITANHVFQTFVKDQHYKSVLERIGEGVLVQLSAITPGRTGPMKRSPTSTASKWRCRRSSATASPGINSPANCRIMGRGAN